MLARGGARWCSVRSVRSVCLACSVLSSASLARSAILILAPGDVGQCLGICMPGRGIAGRIGVPGYSAASERCRGVPTVRISLTKADQSAPKCALKRVQSEGSLMAGPSSQVVLL